MDSITMIPYYSLIPNQISIFEMPESRHISLKQRESFKNLDNNENRYFELSSHSRKRLKRAIAFLIYTTKNKTIRGSKQSFKEVSTEIYRELDGLHQNKINFKITFITLTLSAPQHNTDEEIKSKLLNHFLTTARRKWNMKDYIWKAEKQENENIHFHILTNRYIKHTEIRAVWNEIQNKSGFNYVDIYSSKMKEFFKDGFKKFPSDKRSHKTQLAAFEENKKTGWTNPNSTDIHALYKVKNIVAYMTKYLAKNVTKTERTQKLDELYTQLSELTEQRTQTELNFLMLPVYEDAINKIQTKIDSISCEIESLKAKGVSGKIWAQSQTLSKFSNYIEACHPDNIPDIDFILNNYEYESVIEIGQSKIYTYKFDIEKTKNLKQILDNHLKQYV